MSRYRNKVESNGRLSSESTEEALSSGDSGKLSRASQAVGRSKRAN
ncbi:MAG: hypothetical protein ACO3DY_05155 [Candidatus Nanopelagicaceae bacterium]